MASPPVLEDPNQLTRRAKTRIGVAVVLLAVAIGGLALLSHHKPENTPEETSSQKQESLSSGEGNQALPAPVAPAQISSAQQEPPPAPPAEIKPPETKAPEAQITPPPPPPPAPVVSKLPPEQPKSVAPLMPRSVTAGAQVKSAAPLPAAPKPAPEPAKATPQPVAEKSASIEKPAQIKPEVAPKGFEVQLGVFTDMENAKQLQAKLAEHGIPSHTETKLQIGPFNTKAEAEAAREKLKALGIGSVVVPGK